MTRHVFEVKVQELLGLPVAKILSFSRCSATGMLLLLVDKQHCTLPTALSKMQVARKCRF